MISHSHPQPNLLLNQKARNVYRAENNALIKLTFFFVLGSRGTNLLEIHVIAALIYKVESNIRITINLLCKHYKSMHHKYLKIKLNKKKLSIFLYIMY